MNSTDNRFNELIGFIRDKSGEHQISITRVTSIEDDLGISGIEADHFFSEFSTKFNVDINNFKVENYFYGEPGFLDVIGIESRKKKPFLVGFLEKAIIAGRLDEEVINT